MFTQVPAVEPETLEDISGKAFTAHMVEEGLVRMGLFNPPTSQKLVLITSFAGVYSSNTGAPETYFSFGFTGLNPQPGDIKRGNATSVVTGEPDGVTEVWENATSPFWQYDTFVWLDRRRKSNQEPPIGHAPFSAKFDRPLIIRPGYMGVFFSTLDVGTWTATAQILEIDG